MCNHCFMRCLIGLFRERLRHECLKLFSNPFFTGPLDMCLFRFLFCHILEFLKILLIKWGCDNFDFFGRVIRILQWAKIVCKIVRFMRFTLCFLMDLLIWLSEADMFCFLYERVLRDKSVLKKIRNVENGALM